ncbi:hypothetical protein CN952_21650 [Bacillus cereus]|uniref:hypothetical protein n=1 Tax=Bacillus cereus TaxID=1396 RepID=UPI000BFD1E21|nr:hypothetical protein [Bacillus cereus]PGM69908.1 hypothetical protein CN952_21650 [Bacillus cereus]PGN10576.1 hypothetical protein CN954_19965 [Bacillus cereus]
MNERELTSKNKIVQDKSLEALHPTDTRESLSRAVSVISGLYIRNANEILEEIRLDVDGRYPQNVVSGTITWNSVTSVHWVADLRNIGLNVWTGIIKRKFGETNVFPYTNVKVQVNSSTFPNQQTVEVIFSVGGESEEIRTFQFKSPYFHSVEFEFDAEEGTTPVTTVQTYAHPNHPDNIPNETLSIAEVFKRTGFDVKLSQGNNVIPQSGAGADKKWSSNEMHDAMQAYWSHFANRPQWSLWTFFAASESEEGHSLGGIMFDDIGPNQRQGTAIFNNSFIADPPANDTNPVAWTQRMRFWCACHEMGHTFNLAHSWQKDLGVPWIPLTSDPQSESFMNYPFRVAGGQNKYFQDFEYRFSDQELLFMRHAPERFVQMGNASWFDDHGFEQDETLNDSIFKLELRANRKTPFFQFLEPCVLDMKLTNVSKEPQIVKDRVLSDFHHVNVIIKKVGQQGRRLMPYATYCWNAKNKVIMPEESIYESLFASVGKNGWLIGDPGDYEIQISLKLNNTKVISNILKLRVAPPHGYEQEILAQDFFSEDVGRILTFDGSRYLEKGNNTLREVTERLNEHPVAIHAHIALAKPLAFDYKLLDFEQEETTKVNMISSQPEDANHHFTAALTQDHQKAATTLGPIDYNDYMGTYSKFLAKEGREKDAVETQDILYQVLAERNVPNRVLQAVKNKRDFYQGNINTES